VRFSDFQALIARLRAEVPREYLDGIVDVDVSPKAVPHPVRAEVYTMGECIPLEWSGSGADLQSRVVLYHGSFQALARLSEPGEFDWRQEAWDTLTHELRHHLEWRANHKALEDYDWAAEQNFARHEGQGFDPLFYRSGERVDERAWKVDDDVFVEAGEWRGEKYDLVWHGRRYGVPVPAAPARAVRFLVLDGLDEPPPGDAVLVMRPKARLLDLVRRRAAVVEEVVMVEKADG
jgi:hypothetical protein